MIPTGDDQPVYMFQVKTGYHCCYCLRCQAFAEMLFIKGALQRLRKILYIKLEHFQKLAFSKSFTS